MAIWPGRHIARPQALVESITIPPIPAFAGDLRRLQERTNLSKTDLANRDHLVRVLRCHDMIVGDRKKGKSQLVLFPLRHEDKRNLPAPPAGPVGGGTSAVSDSTTAFPAGRQASHHRQDFLPLGRPQGQKVRTMNTNSTHTFPRLLPGVATVPVSRGSPQGCSEAVLAGAVRKRRLA